MQLYQLQTASMTEKNSFNITNLLHQSKVEWYRGAMVKELLPGADELL